MTTETAIQILSEHLPYVKGVRIDNKAAKSPPTPVQIDNALSFAIAELSRNKHILGIVKAQYEEEKRLMFKYEGKQNGYKYAHRKAALWDLLKKIESTASTISNYCDKCIWVELPDKTSKCKVCGATCPF